MLTPDKITMTLTGIRLGGGSMSEAAVDCPVTFDKSKPGLSQLADCPFSVPTGTYTELNLTFGSTVQFLIDDPTNGFFSTPSGLVTSRPIGGAQTLQVALSGWRDGRMGILIELQRPLTITDTTHVDLSVVINGLQSFKATVNGGVVVLGMPGTSYVDPGRPDLIGAVGSLAKVAFYASQAIGTAGSYCAGNASNLPNPCGGVVPAQGITSVNVYYSEPDAPTIIGMQLNGTPGNCAVGLSFVNSLKGYTGLDAAGNLGWATGADDRWSAYAAEFRMAEVSSLGSATTLYCKNRSTDPAPPGGSYASGAPDIALPSNSLGTFILLAR